MHACRFAHTQDLDTGATTLAFELGQGMRLQSRDAMWLAISRLIEERVGQLQGVADVRRWLLTIGAPLPLHYLLAVVRVVRIPCAHLPFSWMCRSIHTLQLTLRVLLACMLMLRVRRCTPPLDLNICRASIITYQLSGSQPSASILSSPCMFQPIGAFLACNAHIHVWRSWSVHL